MTFLVIGRMGGHNRTVDVCDLFVGVIPILVFLIRIIFFLFLKNFLDTVVLNPSRCL